MSQLLFTLAVFFTLMLGLQASTHVEVQSVKIITNETCSTLKCVVTGSKPAPVITWFLDDQEVPMTAFSYTYEKTTLEAVSNFEFLSCMKEIPNKVTCFARNPNFPSIVKSAEILEKDIPQPDKSPIKSVIIKRNPARCIAEGSRPQPKFDWYNQQGHVVSQSRIRTTYDSKNKRAVAYLEEMRPIGEKMYCFATNPYFPNDTNNDEKDIMGITSFNRPREVSKVVISIDPLRCESFDSEKEPTFNWIVNHKNISKSKFEVKSDKKGETVHATSTLNKVLKPGEVYHVYCLVSNLETEISKWDAADITVDDANKITLVSTSGNYWKQPAGN